MRRLGSFPLALLGLATLFLFTLGLASAGAFTTVHQADAHAVGVIAKLSPTSITVARNKNHHLTCNVTSSSPAVAAFALGDRVKIACAADALVAVADLPKPTRRGPNDDAPKA